MSNSQDDHNYWLKMAQFLYDYADCLDSARYDEWPEFFYQPECRYEIRSRENVELGLPAAIMYCDSHGMILDRVTMLRDALTYRKMYLRHFISNISISECHGDNCQLRANYQVMQTDNDGITTLFSVGQYIDHIISIDGDLKFKEKIVITDTFGIDNMLAVPL